MASTTNAEVAISCLCGAAKQALHLRNAGLHEAAVTLCHCDTCRHSTGLLFTSYLPLSQPPSSLDGLLTYASSPSSARYFCSTCGCHVFCRYDKAGDEHSCQQQQQQQQQWEVATGVVTSSPADDSTLFPLTPSPSPVPWRHQHVTDTGDGGLSVFLGGSPSAPGKGNGQTPHRGEDENDGRDGQREDVLPASCHCGAVQFRITRPCASSVCLRSNFPDLILPYCSTARETIANPSDVKWWLCSQDGGDNSVPAADPTAKYLAGTCACRSCRLASGFEVQAWAFIPRSNIHILAPDGSMRPLAFDASAASPDGATADAGSAGTAATPQLRSYASSQGVVREFCAVCGATVFWHDRWRPDLVDVAVGLLRSADGARATGNWLKWWTGRVSFAEASEEEREGFMALRARQLIRDLEAGLKAWEEEEEDGIK